MTDHTRERQPLAPAAVPDYTPLAEAPLLDRPDQRTEPAAVTADRHAADSLAEARVRADLAALVDALDAGEADQ